MHLIRKKSLTPSMGETFLRVFDTNSDSYSLGSIRAKYDMLPGSTQSAFLKALRRTHRLMNQQEVYIAMWSNSINSNLLGMLYSARLCKNGCEVGNFTPRC